MPVWWAVVVDHKMEKKRIQGKHSEIQREVVREVEAHKR